MATKEKEPTQAQQTPEPLNVTQQAAGDPEINPLAQPAGTTSYDGFVRPGDKGADGKPAIGIKDWT